MLPRPETTDFLRRSIRPKPDLYGPFWVCVTLVFSVAISGMIQIIRRCIYGTKTHYMSSTTTLMIKTLNLQEM